MAIATFDRDPARPTAASEPRFKLLDELCRAGDAVFWRAQDRRSGRACVVRVFDSAREDTSRRLGELHRERTLAERLALPEVLRTDVPLIDGDRIHQLVDPEPVRLVEPRAEGGRLAVLTVLVSVARVLAAAHAQGAFHGGFGRASCLRTAAGRLVLHGFCGDAPAAATVRDGIAADHRAFLEFALEMLDASGGPPPRLRRYFARQLAPDAPRPPVDALLTLSEELRESLEDTFPWPAAEVAPPVMPVTSARQPAAEPTAVAAPRAPVPTLAAAAPSVPASASAAPRGRPERKLAAAAVMPAPTTLAGPPAVAQVTVAPAVAPPDLSEAPDVLVATEAPRSEAGRSAAKPAEVWYPPQPPAGSETSVADPDQGSGRSAIRPWIAAMLLLGALVLFWQFGTKSGAARGPGEATPAAAEPARTLDPPAPSAPTAASPRDAGGQAQADTPASTGRAEPTGDASPGAVAARRPQTTAPLADTPSNTTALPGTSAAEDAQARRSRVASLVTRGSRALEALEPRLAAEAFAAALALAPNDGAAQEGARRARRLAGVEALMRDAREAVARGEHARAVQGYAQALSADPRNRGLADALASARRGLARDPVGQLLAEGHAALGAGRLEAARSAFERALAADPAATGARRGIEQADTAIALRDQAAERRLAALDTLR